MNKSIEQFKKESEETRMTKSESSLMKERLISFAKTSPQKRVVSPYVTFFQSAYATPVYVLLLLIIVSVPVSGAARNSLPGEPLYSVKTQVIEPMQGSLRLSNEGKSRHYTELANRRVSELLQVTRLEEDNPDVTGEIIEEATENATRALDYIEKVRQNKGELYSLELSSDLAVSIEAYSETIERTSEEDNPMEDLTRVVEESFEESIDKFITGQDALTTESFIETYLTGAEEEVSEAEEELRENPEDLEASTTIEAVEDSLTTIQSNLTASKPKEALEELIKLDHKLEIFERIEAIQER